MNSYNMLDEHEERRARVREGLSQRYAAGEPREDIRRQLCRLNVDTVVTARAAMSKREAIQLRNII
ncbi:MAG: hypothetical protein LBQ48_06040 [Oscillospiraceae bacterium]|nr:hypothetical protein [Oscillospiraceae bacterium]